MSLIEFDVWTTPVDLSSPPDARLSTDDSLTDAGFNPVLYGEGDGFLEIHADHPDTQYLQRRGFVRAVRTDTDEPIFDFLLEEADTKILAKDSADKLIRWSGRGALYLWDRYRLGQAVYAPGQPNRGSISIIDYWTWVNISPGGILRRVWEEGFNHPSAFYANTSVDFTRVIDSNAETWVDVTDYQTRIGTTGLQVVADMMRQGLMVRAIPDTDSVLFQAFKDFSFRADRTTATFTAGKVRFEGGVNVAVELPQKIAALRERTHTLTRRKDGQYATETNNGSGEPYMDFQEVPYTSDPAAVEAFVAAHHLSLQKQSRIAVVQHRLEATSNTGGGPGSADGQNGYWPSPDGDYWTGDLVTVHTGTEEYDLTEQTLEVAGIRYFLRGADWMVECQLGAQVLNASGNPIVPGGGTTVINRPVSIQLCQPSVTVDTEAEFWGRLYFSNSTFSAFTPTADAGWDAGSAVLKRMKLTADGDLGSTQQVADSGGGDADGRNILKWQGIYGPLSTDEAAAIAAGGLTVRGQLRARMRYGIGISEAAQDGIGQIGIRVTQGASTTIRGTALALHGLTSSAGSTKWVANATKVNRVFPPAAAGDTLSAVGGTAAGDYLLFELGVRNYTETGEDSGSALAMTNSSDTDLPYDESTTAANNSYIDLFTAGSTNTVGGDGRPELIGTSIRAKRCDDTEHFHATGDAAPTADDDGTAGFRRGTLWINDSGEMWYLADNAEGEADWIAITGATGPIALDDLTDATISSPADGEVLTYDSGTSQWVNEALPATAAHNHTGDGDGGDLDAPVIDGYAVFNEESAPSTPASGTVRVYAKADGRVYSMDDAGTEYGPFDAAGGSSPAVVSGGTETDDGTHQWNAFTSNGTLTVSSTGLADVLIVGGGGGGAGYYSGGGGGAGDVLLLKQITLEAGSYSVTVGAGGAGATGTTSGASDENQHGRTGNPSKLGSLFAAGGGGGIPEAAALLGGQSAAAAYSAGASSGGGGSRNAVPAGFVIGGGNTGGASRTGNTAGTGAGGGGGGASAAGAQGTTGNVGGDGGAGLTVSEFSAFGASGVFGGGGGGGGVTTGGNGGTGGGGHGGGTSANTGITAGTANTGGGGGGGGNTGTTGAVGQAGGSGVVIVRTEL